MIAGSESRKSESFQELEYLQKSGTSSKVLKNQKTCKKQGIKKSSKFSNNMEASLGSEQPQESGESKRRIFNMYHQNPYQENVTRIQRLEEKNSEPQQNQDLSYKILITLKTESLQTKLEGSDHGSSIGLTRKSISYG